MADLRQGFGDASRRILLVGGSGSVGTLITPYIRRRHHVRVLDLSPPSTDQSLDYINGSMTDPSALTRALDGMDTFINLVMRSPLDGRSRDQDVTAIVDNYEVNTLGLHLLFWTAHGMGIRRGVHTSTMSVHDRNRRSYEGEDLVPLNSPNVYGLTKEFGERICRYFADWFEMRIIALRLTGPQARSSLETSDPADKDLHLVDEEDLANAYLSAIDRLESARPGFEAVFIAGDPRNEMYNVDKARRLLGWVPRG